MLDSDNHKNKLVSSTYKKLGSGLLVTGLVALIVNLLFGDLLLSIYSSGSTYMIVNLVLILGMVALVVSMTSKIAKRDFKAVRNIYYAITVLFGIVLSSLFLVYSIKLIVSAFAITAILFFVLSKITIKDTSKLNKWYRFASVGLLVLIAASVIGLFLGNTGFNLIISIVGVTLFALFIVFDTNRLIESGKHTSAEDIELVSYLYALELYLDVINIFQYILNILGFLDD